ncbi:MAG: hypothetical protein KDD60_13120 [Bdellovibrionales bacterium]|nr:hypothetical protein [Bdellovibrionales bacterium]
MSNGTFNANILCAHCGKEIPSLPSSAHSVGRRETCPSCDGDLHCCLQCEFFDRSAYNECREPQADRVLDKDRSNHCDYFRITQNLNQRNLSQASQKQRALADLDKLFK